MVIWKYEIGALTRLAMPAGAKILHVGEQRGELRLWALVDRGAPLEIREFYVVGTGQEFIELGRDPHLGTVVMPGGDYVWHVFEREIDTAQREEAAP